VHSLKELIALARSHPGEIIYGTTGGGSASHLGMAIFTALTHLNMPHVIYKSEGPAIEDVAAGKTHLTLMNLAAVQPMLKSGQLRALLVAGPHRPASLPNVPTAAESGLPGFSVLGWYALLAPAGTPPAIRDRIHDDFVRALHAEDVTRSLTAGNNEIVGGTSDELLAFLRKEIAQYAAVVKANNIKPD